MADTLRERLAGVLAEGSRSDKALARFMLNAVDELPFETAAGVARRVGVSEATVSRFCRTLGYQGFRAVRDELRPRAASSPWLESHRLTEVQRGAADHAARARGLELEIAALVRVHELAATPDWARVVDRLADCPRVFVAGFQTERGIAQYFANQLQYVRDGVLLLDSADGNFAPLLASDGPACLVLFEARRYSRLARVLAAEARAAGLPVTLVTDLFCDWGGAVATEVFALPTQVGQFWESSAPRASLGNLLVNGVCARRGPQVEARLSRIAGLYGRFTGHVGDPAGKLAR